MILEPVTLSFLRCKGGNNSNYLRGLREEAMSCHTQSNSKSACNTEVAMFVAMLAILTHSTPLLGLKVL